MGISIPSWRAAAQMRVPLGTLTGWSSMVRVTSCGVSSLMGLYGLYGSRLLSSLFKISPVTRPLPPLRLRHGVPWFRRCAVSQGGHPQDEWGTQGITGWRHSREDCTRWRPHLAWAMRRGGWRLKSRLNGLRPQSPPARTRNREFTSLEHGARTSRLLVYSAARQLLSRADFPRLRGGPAPRHV